METTRNLNLNVEACALKYHVMSTILYLPRRTCTRKNVQPKTWRILAFADGISMTTGPYISW